MRKPASAADGEAFVASPGGAVHWGLHGAAGLLCWDRDLGVLLQQRAAWTHHGGTWGLPGGALRAGERAVDGALREAAEEAGVPSQGIRLIGSHLLDMVTWSYTTVVAEVVVPFTPRIADAESAVLEWVPLDAVGELKLHPDFALAWPKLRPILR